MKPDQIYQELLLDHYKHPRHFRRLSNDVADADMFNQLCGDHIRLHLDICKGVIENACFDGDGCAISIAYTSLMMAYVKDTSIPTACKYTDRMIKVLEGARKRDSAKIISLDPLNIAKEFPMRSKCASLGWYALKKVLDLQ